MAVPRYLMGWDIHVYHRSPSKTPKNRRGDIHSTLSLTPSRRSPHKRPPPTNSGDLFSDDLNSDLPGRPPVSSGPMFSAPPVPSEDEPDEIRAIWGTTVNLGETMKSFREFLRGFKIKYRVNHDREQGRSRTLGSTQEGEVVLYEQYLRRMRQTGETNLNLDMVNLIAYPPSKKLYTQLAKYPQEVVPAMDQVLKDLMLELAEQDQSNSFDDMTGPQGEEEIAEIMTKVYKIRPFGVETVNMRELNPNGTSRSFFPPCHL